MLFLFINIRLKPRTRIESTRSGVHPVFARLLNLHSQNARSKIGVFFYFGGITIPTNKNSSSTSCRTSSTKAIDFTKYD